MADALSSFRICDFTGILAGAGATKWLAGFGAEVIRIEDPVREGRWDILRGRQPWVDERRGINLGGAFNNHNVGKLGITLNLRTEKAREILDATHCRIGRRDGELLEGRDGTLGFRL